MRKKGIVVKIKDSYGIVLTKDGIYHKVSPAVVKNARVGSEVEFTTAVWQRYVKHVLLAASVIIMLLGFNLYQAATTQVYAYISLDINPSLELGIDKNTKVIAINPLNEDAKKLLLSANNLDKQDLKTCIDSLVAKSIQMGYLKPQQDNYLLSTITFEGNPTKTNGYNIIAKNIEEPLKNKGIPVDVVILSSNSNTRDEALKKGVSTGKLTVYKNALASGNKVTLEEVKKTSLKQLVDKKKVKLLPKNSKSLIKSTHISPRVVNKPQTEKNLQIKIKNRTEKQPDLLENKNREKPEPSKAKGVDKPKPPEKPELPRENEKDNPKIKRPTIKDIREKVQNKRKTSEKT